MKLFTSFVGKIEKPSDFHSFLLVELLAVLFIIFLGAVAFTLVEGWKLFDSLYFVVVTMATIGYGDFVPMTMAGKSLAMLYAIMGVPLFVYTTSILLDYRFQKYIKSYEQLLKQQHKRDSDLQNSLQKKSWFSQLFSRRNKSPQTVDVEESVSEINEKTKDTEPPSSDAIAQ